MWLGSMSMTAVCTEGDEGLVGWWVGDVIHLRLID